MPLFYYKTVTYVLALPVTYLITLYSLLPPYRIAQHSTEAKQPKVNSQCLPRWGKGDREAVDEVCHLKEKAGG